MIDALQLIFQKSPAAASQAMKTISAIRGESPAVQQRYQRAVDAALNDPHATFSEEERARLSSYLAAPNNEKRSALIQIRVTPTEKVDVQIAAEQEGFSDGFIKHCIRY